MELDLEDVLQQAVSDIQGMIDKGFVEESDDDIYKAFGGKKGEGKVSVPKNITDKQILAYFDFIGRPLSTKEEKETVISAVRNRMTTKPVVTKGKPVAKFDPRTATLREVAEIYAEKSGRGKAFVGPTLQYFSDIADEPGSALRLFEKDADGLTLLARTFKDTPEDAPIKTAMQNLRQVGLTLKAEFGPDTPEYKLLPDKAPNTDINVRIFGREEPPKAVSEVAVTSDRKKLTKLFEEVSKKLDDPKTRPIAQAILFNLNTGLRPNAVAGLTVSSYKPDTGAIYVQAETKGAKGRAVNIPLNPIADSILQQNLQAGVTDNFFVKPNGKAVTSQDMTDLLRELPPIPEIAYDSATDRYFDTLVPEGFTGKKGSALLRNIHASVGRSIGIEPAQLAYLQGRSLKATYKTGTGELASYQVAMPGEVSEVDRANASMFSSFYADGAKEAGFDIGTYVPMPTERITSQTAGYEDYFKLPVKEEVPQASSTAITDNLSKQPSVALMDDLAKNNLDWGNILKNFGKKTLQAIPVAGAGLAYSSRREAGASPLEAGVATALEETVMAVPSMVEAGIQVGEAVGEAVTPMITEQVQEAEKETGEGFVSGMARSLTGGGLDLNLFNSGGFVNK